ncbi:MAG TPA: PilZ domain-containing protein [Myxococcales bacterium]|nr:PilZ domain-containing protein [Myxococcales bacterium]
MDTRVTTLLKYRFGDLKQMNNHLHVIDGRTLLFYRSSGRVQLASGQRVVVELSLVSSEQVTALRGSVLALEGDMSNGVWIEFPDAKLARKLAQGGAGAITARSQRRIGCDLMVELKCGDLPLLGRMVDVSMAGARIVGASGLCRDADVELRIMGALPPVPSIVGKAQVARSENGGDIGVRFLRSDPAARVGAGKLFHAVQQAWTKAPELTHSPLCCQNGTVLEPPLPRLRTTRA